VSAVRAALAASLVLLGACATAGKIYPEDPNGNLVLRAEVERGVDAAVYIHRIAAGCARELRGVVRLDNRPATIDLPVGQAAYLLADFDSSSFLAGARRTSSGAALLPRAGYRYQLELRYREGIYDVSLSEQDERTGVRRVLPRREADSCKD
jgi:hypothetical protein